MALTESKMLPLGTQAPAFELPDTESHLVSLKDFEGKQGLLIMFICNHCPYVIHVKEAVAKLTDELLDSNFGVVAINSNDIIKYPADNPTNMRIEKETSGYNFPYLFDETQNVARAYDAACTPDFYLFDANLKLFYRGRMDESRPGNDKPNDGRDLRNAIKKMLEGSASVEPQYPSMGCNIKWK